MIPTVDIIRDISQAPASDTALNQFEKIGYSDPTRALSMLADLADKTSELNVNRESFVSLAAALETSFDPQRGLNNMCALLTRASDETSRKYLSLFSDNPDQTAALLSIFSGSQHLAMDILRDADTFLERIVHHPWDSWDSVLLLAERINGLVTATDDFEQAITVLRQFKRAEYLQIAMCDLMKAKETSEVLRGLSDVADVSLQAAMEISTRELDPAHGTPLRSDGEASGFAVLGMGKLGGRELNFSSDIDIIFVYDTPKGRTSRSGISTYEYYPKLARMITDAIHRVTSEGFVFRVDLRLRPEGSAGDIANSADGYERHYDSRGQIWERQALIKARPLAGCTHTGQDFIDRMAPFVFDSHSDPLILDDINRNREKIAHALLKRGNGKHHVKLAPGGIREIEFLTQGFQLIHTGPRGWPWERGTLAALERVTSEGFLTDSEASDLSEAYLFLRDLENRIQIFSGHQSHEIPPNSHDQSVLAKMMGLRAESTEKCAEQLLSRYYGHTGRVLAIYERIFHTAM